MSIPENNQKNRLKLARAVVEYLETDILYGLAADALMTEYRLCQSDFEEAWRDHMEDEDEEEGESKKETRVDVITDTGEK